MECEEIQENKYNTNTESIEEVQLKKTEHEHTIKMKDINLSEFNDQKRVLLKKELIDHLSSNENVFFNSPEKEICNRTNKINMLEELLNNNYGLFLAKFGNHLLNEHLCYFENRSEEESLIVDLYLRQIKKEIERKQQLESKLKCEVAESIDVSVDHNPAEVSTMTVRHKLLDHISLSIEAHFKSQQVGEPDLRAEEKRDIAERLLDRNAGLFLARFGTHLLEEHLSFFDQLHFKENYEVQYHLSQLRKTHCKSVSEMGIKNRRFEALKKMVEEGSYFSETEMRNRNPLLYEQLVGKFLSTEERRERLNNIDTTNITFVNLLLEQMDREAVKKLKKEQEDAEDDVMEEEEVESVEADMETEEDDSEEDNNLDKTLWGEKLECNSNCASISKIRSTIKFKKRKTVERKTFSDDVQELPEGEKHLLMEEFRSNMFLNFLQGRDKDFDYSQVDYNSDYDDLDVRGQDEEEMYFDQESSHSSTCGKQSEDGDLLEEFMSGLKSESNPQQLAEQFKHLGHEHL